jgi:hypothetical protein
VINIFIKNNQDSDKDKTIEKRNQYLIDEIDAHAEVEDSN